jgi:hypothetical protein
MLSLALLVLALPPTRSADQSRVAQCRALTKTAEAPTTVPGRLYAANGGGSGFRIWIVGTKRVVWITPKIDPAVPSEIRDRFKPFDEELSGHFTFVPLAPDRPGVMREVCLVSANDVEVRPARGRPGPAPPASAGHEWPEADVRWLDTWRAAAFDALMPLDRRDGQGLAYRRYRDLYHDVPELSFSIEVGERPAAHAAATLVEPVGSSIQDQLLELHAHDPEAPLRSLLPRVTLRHIDLAHTSCPALDAQLRALPRLTPATLNTHVVVPHPLVQRLVISTTTIHVDVTLFDAAPAVTAWVDRTIAAIRGCGRDAAGRLEP